VTSTVDSSNFIEDLNHVLYFDFGLVASLTFGIYTPSTTTVTK